MRVCVIGTGRLALGLIVEAFVAGGHEVTLLGRNPEVHDRLERAGGYWLRLGDAGGEQHRWVTGFRSRLVADACAPRAVSRADVVATATGLGAYVPVAELLAHALPKSRPVNVLCFENGSDVATRLGCLVASAATERAAAPAAGFAGAVVSRIVSRVATDPDGALAVFGDPPGDITVDRSGLVAELPGGSGLVTSDAFPAVSRRKLSTFSAAHATAAYVGWLKGYRYVHAAIRDPQVRRATDTAVREGQAGLTALFGSDVAGGPELVRAILRRLDNAGLDDPVARVGADPLRKLGHAERLVGSAVLAEEAGVPPRALALSTAAALSFYRAGGGTWSPRDLLSRVARVDLDGAFAREVLRVHAHFDRHAMAGSALVDLERSVWSCSSRAHEAIA